MEPLPRAEHAPGPSRAWAGSAQAGILLSVAALGACGEAAPVDEPRVAARDSAGVEIAESHAPRIPDSLAWRLADEPTLHIGAGEEGDPDLQFARIASVHRLAGGGMAVVDLWAPALSFFDASGELVGRFAGVGEGPGELPSPRGSTRLQGSFTCGTDTLYVSLPREVAAYAPPGNYVRSFSLEQPGRIAGCSGGELILIRGHSEWREEPGIYTDSSLVVVHDLEGAERVVIDTLPFQERAYSFGAHGGTGYAPLVFGRALSLAARDGVLAAGFSDEFRVELRDGRGELRRVLRVEGRGRPVSAGHIDRFREFVSDPWRGNDDERARLDELLEEVRSRELPAFAELRFDDAGNLWVREYDHLDAVRFWDYSDLIPGLERPHLEHPRRWVVLAPDGRYLGEVSVPPEFEIHDIARDRVLGVWRDALDIEYVREYPLIRP